jgi:hypothetical protein
MGVSAQFSDPASRIPLIKIPINPPYLKLPDNPLNELGLPEMEFYHTKDLCKILKVKPWTIRYRFRRGYYKEPMRAGVKRQVSEMDLWEIIKATKALTDTGICD